MLPGLNLATCVGGSYAESMDKRMETGCAALVEGVSIEAAVMTTPPERGARS
jgi:hypothetical protein